jgi:hypothetical protein
MRSNFTVTAHRNLGRQALCSKLKEVAQRILTNRERCAPGMLAVRLGAVGVVEGENVSNDHAGQK